MPSAVKTLPPVLTLGDEGLRQVCRPVVDFEAGSFEADTATLMAVLEDFRATQGFGRAIAAPQIGITQRFIAMNLGDGPFIIANPQITWRSSSTIRMWDDCMSFPHLMVQVERANSISIAYRDRAGLAKTWEKLPTAVSELLQHEIDHLDGILAVDRAVDENAIIERSDYERHRTHYDSMVKYSIQPTG